MPLGDGPHAYLIGSDGRCLACAETRTRRQIEDKIKEITDSDQPIEKIIYWVEALNWVIKPTEE